MCLWLLAIKEVQQYVSDYVSQNLNKQILDWLKQISINTEVNQKYSSTKPLSKPHLEQTTKGNTTNFTFIRNMQIFQMIQIKKDDTNLKEQANKGTQTE